MSGTNRFDFSPLIKKIWEKYSDDGWYVNSAYGYYLFNNLHGESFNQWNWVVNKLRHDRDSRQCVLNINQSYHKIGETKDFPCTVYCQVFIRDNKLVWITNMRSNDIFFGFRNDVFCFTELQKLMAKDLNVKVGKYIHFVGSLHLYEDQFGKVERFVSDYS